MLVSVSKINISTCWFLRKEKLSLIISVLPTPEVQNAGDVFGARTFIVSNIKMFTSPRIISPMLCIIIQQCGRFL